MISKDDFIKERLKELIRAAEIFIKDNDVNTLNKALKKYNSSSTDYDDLELPEKFKNQQIEDRKNSSLPVEILEEGDKLFLKLNKASFEESDKKLWESLFEKIFELCKNDIEISKEKETINWIARSLGFVSNQEKQIEFIKFFWTICSQEISPYTESYASLINFLILRMSQENVLKIKDFCVLSKNNKYTPSLAEAYREMNLKSI